MTEQNLKGKWALVTGASSGIGVDFSRELAKLGTNLILVARREERLEAVKKELEERYNIQAEVIAMDMAQPEAPQTLYDRVKTMGKTVDVLVNNAGFGLYGEFVNIPWEQEETMLRLNVLTLTHLTKLFAKDMVAQDYGYILQVASTGAYQPTPTYAAYAATKSYVLNFGEALNYELRNTHVSCTVISPGVTETEFFKVSGQKKSLYQRMTVMKSADVARIGIQSMLKRRSSVVAGWVNALSVWLNRLSPRRVSAAISYRLMMTGE